VPPLAKKGLTHLLSSSSALFHRKRQLRSDADAKSLSVGYSGSSVTLSSVQSESVSLSDLSASAADSATEPQTTQCQNVDTNVVPVVCGDVTFLMVKDDFCQKPTDASAVDKTEDSSSESSSFKDSGLSLKTSSLPSNETLNFADKNDKAAGSDMGSVRPRQVSNVCTRFCCQNISCCVELVAVVHKRVAYCCLASIWYDTIRLTILTYAQKLTSSQLNLPHGTEQKE